jgi:benzoyl-CoA reductase/2-hydroxyglutaryl-CoA dehydratase subunit BcrC/BadD/HgdB
MSPNEQQTKQTIGYTCSYAPLELLDSFGLIPIRAFGLPEAVSISDAYIHSNFCGYVKNIINSYHGMDMLFVDTCCQIKRTYDSWHNFFPGSFSYLLNLPRNNTVTSREFWTTSLQDMIFHLEEALGIKFNPTQLQYSIYNYRLLRDKLKEVENLLLANQIFSHQYIELLYQVQTKEVTEAIRLADNFLGRDLKRPPHTTIPLILTGSIIAALPLAQTIEELGGNIIYFDTCCTSRWYQKDIVMEVDDPLSVLAQTYLGQTPCPRMNNSFERFDKLRQIIHLYGVKGVIHHSLKFCDVFIYESYPYKLFLDKTTNTPLLRIESDYDFGVSGQIATRLQALMEMLQK